MTMKLDVWIYADRDVVKTLDENDICLDVEVVLEEELKKVLKRDDIDVTLKSIIAYGDIIKLSALWEGEKHWVGYFLKSLTDKERQELFDAVLLIHDPLSQKLLKQAAAEE